MDERLELQNKQFKQWILFAQQDLKVGELSLKEDIYSVCCFHCQQAVEKLLKAFWLKRYKKVPKIHSLDKLRSGLEKIDNSWSEFKEEVRGLDRFYTSVRYPDILAGSLPEGLPSKTDAKKAIQYAKEIFEFSKEFSKDV